MHCAEVTQISYLAKLGQPQAVSIYGSSNPVDRIHEFHHMGNGGNFLNSIKIYSSSCLQGGKEHIILMFRHASSEREMIQIVPKKTWNLAGSNSTAS